MIKLVSYRFYIDALFYVEKVLFLICWSFYYEWIFNIINFFTVKTIVTIQYVVYSVNTVNHIHCFSNVKLCIAGINLTWS